MINQRLSGLPRVSKMDPVSRREFLRKLSYSAVMLGAGPTLLAACGTDSSTTTRPPGTTAAGATAATTTPAATAPVTKEFTFANWPFYIDVPISEEPDAYFETTSLDDFTATTGIKVNYLEEVTDNNDWFGKYQEALSRGQDIERDLVALTYWMAARMIKLGYAAKLDRAAIPNAANLLEAYAHTDYDPERAYTLPWQSGVTGLGYDISKTGRELTSFNDIFDPAFKGKVTMLTEMRDSIGLTLLGMGKDPAKVTFEEAQAAATKIDEAVKSGHIRQFTDNSYTELLTSGDSWVSMAWSGDMIQLQATSEDLRFLAPEEGVMLWWDDMLVIKDAKNKAAAEAFMNYVYDPTVAAKIESWVNYVCPVAGAQEKAADIDPALAENTLIFPDQATLDKTHVFRTLDEAEEIEFDTLFQGLIGA